LLMVPRAPFYPAVLFLPWTESAHRLHEEAPLLKCRKISMNFAAQQCR